MSRMTTFKTEDLVEPNNSNLESIELDMEIDEDVLVQLDGLLKWMDCKIESMKKLCPWLLVSYK